MRLACPWEGQWLQLVRDRRRECPKPKLAPTRVRRAIATQGCSTRCARRGEADVPSHFVILRSRSTSNALAEPTQPNEGSRAIGGAPPSPPHTKIPSEAEPAAASACTPPPMRCSCVLGDEMRQQKELSYGCTATDGHYRSGLEALLLIKHKVMCNARSIPNQRGHAPVMCRGTASERRLSFMLEGAQSAARSCLPQPSHSVCVN
eukprot:scaffold189345_cov23-Tisochrysis_lutea.AAC.2